MPASYDRQINGILVSFFDNVETRLIERRICRPDEVSERLATDYVEACGRMQNHSVQYHARDEWLAAQGFLNQLMRQLKLGREFRFQLPKCWSHFVANTADYLPDFPAILEQRFMKFMSSSPKVEDILFSGIVRQACASLDRNIVLAVVDRELRRQGATRNLTIVSQEQVELRRNVPMLKRTNHRYLR